MLRKGYQSTISGQTKHNLVDENPCWYLGYGTVERDQLLIYEILTFNNYIP